jgi:hypothetical protein
MAFSWFKVSSNFIDDLRFRDFTDTDLAIWVSLQCLANRSEVRGTIPTNVDGVAWSLRRRKSQVEKTLSKLAGKKLVTVSESEIVLVDWLQTQYDSPSDYPDATRERKRRQREKQRADSDTSQDVSQDGHEASRIGHDTDKIRKEKNRLREDERELDDSSRSQGANKYPEKVISSETETSEIARIQANETSPSPGSVSTTINEAAGRGGGANHAERGEGGRGVETRIPDDFAVTDAMRAWAISEGVTADLEYQTKRFINFHKARTTKLVNWLYEWQNWVTNNYSTNNHSGGNTNDSTIQRRLSKSERIAANARSLDAEIAALEQAS